MSTLQHRKSFNGHMQSRNISYIEPWDLVHAILIVPYGNSVMRRHPGVDIFLKVIGIT